MFDFIGDIHGHADKLAGLLQKLGYIESGGVYKHPTRRVFFLGDFIDRGPKIREVLNIVIPMIESGSALAVMGNHEFNYLGFHTQTNDGTDYLRPRNKKNIKECLATVQQLSGPENERLLAWIWHLPIWHETHEFRAIHACWDDNQIKLLSDHAPQRKLHLKFLHDCSSENSPLHHAIETVLKGPEIDLPDELHFKDNYENLRSKGRICWWDLSRKVVVPNRGIDPYIFEREMNKLNISPLAIKKPTFFGHYWESGTPRIVNPKAVCLDYSAAKADGYLCAYRFDGEEDLISEKLVWIS